jgi:hypothetical protein
VPTGGEDITYPGIVSKTVFKVNVPVVISFYNWTEKVFCYNLDKN